MPSGAPSAWTDELCHLHAASKYCRWEVREALMQRAVDAGATCIFDTGNWIDGEARFNLYDLEAVGVDAQLAVLAKNYPKLGIPTFAVTGVGAAILQGQPTYWLLPAI